MLLQRTRLLVVTLWAGSLWAIGYVVAPTLFATLADRALAGTIAGSMFRSEAWVSFACALVLLVLLTQERDGRKRRTLSMLVIAIVACVMVNYFGVQPVIAGLREAAGAGGVVAAAARSQFGMLHGAAMGIYLVQSILAVFLVVKN